MSWGLQHRLVLGTERGCHGLAAVTFCDCLEAEWAWFDLSVLNCNPIQSMQDHRVRRGGRSHNPCGKGSLHISHPNGSGFHFVIPRGNFFSQHRIHQTDNSCNNVQKQYITAFTKPYLGLFREGPLLRSIMDEGSGFFPKWALLNLSALYLDVLQWGEVGVDVFCPVLLKLQCV